MGRGLALAVFLLAAVAIAAQPRVDDLEKRLPALAGAERARALTELTGLLNNDNPRKAIAYGNEALAWYAAHPDPHEEAHTLAILAWAHMILSDYPTAIATAEKGRALAVKNGDAEGQAHALNSLGVIAQRRGEAVEAIERFTDALALYRKAGKASDIANALGNLGFVYSTGLADYDRALSYGLEGLKIREALGNDAEIALSLNALGIIYDRTGDYGRALDYFQQALELRRNSGAKNRIAATLSNISDVYGEQGEYSQALEQQLQALALRREVGDAGGEAMSLRSIGEIQLEMGNLAEARHNLDEALRIAERIGDKGTRGRALLTLSRASRLQGRGLEAEAYARRALAIAEETSGRELRRVALEELSAAQEKAGDYAGALASYKRFKQENDRVFDQEKAKRLELLERRYQSERREKEIVELRQGEADRALEAARQRSLRNLVAGSAVVCALAGFGLYRRRVESARLSERLSVTDALTGLKNRRYVLQTIGAETAAVQRRLRDAPAGVRPDDADLIVLMIDIDKFKSVNDELGHKAGDAVLAQVADVLNQSCRASDVVARWGGDEFLVVSRFTDRRRGSALAERIRSAIEERPFDLGDGRTIHRTCSIGVAAYPFSLTHVDALGWEQVTAVADQAMYLAKRSGANAWVAVTASEAATAEGLQRLPEDSLSRWITDGTVSVETR
jgi:diguanylate cyclase (GGDEF)-like protein